jgi:hypothetical protein
MARNQVVSGSLVSAITVPEVIDQRMLRMKAPDPALFQSGRQAKPHVKSNIVLNQ